MEDFEKYSESQKKYYEENKNGSYEYQWTLHDNGNLFFDNGFRVVKIFPSGEIENF